MYPTTWSFETHYQRVRVAYSSWAAAEWWNGSFNLSLMPQLITNWPATSMEGIANMNGNGYL